VAPQATIIRIELWHGILLIVLLGLLAPARLIEPWALVVGGLFMGANFFLLGFGVLWVLKPLAGKGKIKAGVALLVLKFLVFLGLLSVVFFRFSFDVVSFALGFSTLLIAIMLETVRIARLND
jgi:hypothetical protein